MLLKAKYQLKMRILTFSQMDCIRVNSVRYIHRGTLSQMDCIQKLLAKGLRMHKTFDLYVLVALVATTSNHISHCGGNSVNSSHSDDEDGNDMVTGANLTPQTVPEFLVGLPMQSLKRTPHQQCTNDDTLATTPPAQTIPVHTNTTNNGINWYLTQIP